MTSLYIYDEPSKAELSQRTDYRKKHFTDDEREYLLIMSYLYLGGKGWIGTSLKTLRERNSRERSEFGTRYARLWPGTKCDGRDAFWFLQSNGNG